MSELIPVRYHFRSGRAVQHVRGRTYAWVHSIDGKHLAYVVVEEIVYEPTLEAQIARSKRQ